MNLILGEELVRLGGFIRLPGGAEKSARAIGRHLRSRQVSDGDSIVLLDVGEHGSDPDQREMQWLMLRRTLAAHSSVRPILCGGFDNGAAGRPSEMHDLKFGSRSHNDAIRAAAGATIEGVGPAAFLELSGPIAAFHRRLLAGFGVGAYHTDGVHLNVWGQLKLCTLILRAACPARALDPAPILELIDSLWAAMNAPSRAAAEDMVRLSFQGSAPAPPDPAPERPGHTRTLSFGEARARLKGNPVGRWTAVADDLAGEVWPAITPSFKLRPGDTVFTIGSCFAREIEDHLVALGCEVPMAGLKLPPNEWHGPANAAMNKFHPPAFRQSLAWTAAIHDRDAVVRWTDCEALALDCGDGLFLDLDLACAPVDQARFIERRQHIFDVFRAAFSADCLMMTPGLIEAWRDKITGLYIHEAPTGRAARRQESRWELDILSHERCLADLLEAIDLVRARNPEVKVLVTTSPIPMSATFSGEDVRIANAFSKSILRAACGAVAGLRDQVDYFPSYESVVLSAPANVWSEDRIHVAPSFVGKIVIHMLDHYFENSQDAAAHYRRARAFLLEAKPTEAEMAARAALAVEPDHVDARIVLAEALMRQGRCVEAEALLKGFLARDLARPDLWIALARTIARGDKTRAAEAVAHIETAAAMDDIGIAEFRSVAGFIRRKAPAPIAERLMRRAVDLFPEQAESYPLLIDVLLDQGRDAEAEVVMRQFIEAVPMNAMAYAPLASAMLKNGAKAEAIEVLRRATALRRPPVELLIQLARLLAETGDMGGAQAAARNALILAPRNPEVVALADQLFDRSS